MRIPISVAVLAFTLTACAHVESGSEGVKTEEIATGDGYSLLRISGAAPETPAIQGRLIGEKEGPNLLHDIRSVLIGRDGNVYVASAGTRRVLVFDTAGNHLRDIGRTGQGPGEYVRPLSMAFFGEELLVMDAGNRRIGRFSLTGDWLGSLPGPRGAGSVWSLGDDAVAYAGYDMRGDEPRASFMRLLSSGLVDTTPQVHSDSLPPARSRGRSIDCEAGESILLFGSSYRAAAIQHPGRDGKVILIPADEFRLIFLNSPGDTAKVVERMIEPASVPDDEWQKEVDRHRTFMSKVPAGSRCNFNQLERVSQRQVISDVFYDSDGMLWVDANTANGRFFEVFEPDGRLAQRVASVPRLDAVTPYVRGDLMAVVEVDSVDIQQIRLYKVTRAAR